MKKVFLLLTLISLPLFLSAQTMEKQYYIYNIVTFSGSLKNEGTKVTQGPFPISTNCRANGATIAQNRGFVH